MPYSMYSSFWPDNRLVTGQKTGGQALLGGLDCLVHRNFFGGQIHSFEALLPVPACLQDLDDHGAESGDSARDYSAVFIRAPAVMETGPSVEVLAKYGLTPEERAAQVRPLAVDGSMRIGAGCNLLAPGPAVRLGRYPSIQAEMQSLISNLFNFASNIMPSRQKGLQSGTRRDHIG